LQTAPLKPPSSDDIERLSAARHHDPGAVLGLHATASGPAARAFVPGAVRVTLADTGAPMQRVGGSDVFEWTGPGSPPPQHFRVTWWDRAGTARTHFEPYSFPPQLSEFDLHLFGEGTHMQAQRFMGAHVRSVDDVAGTLFAVWAPNAERVSVVGDFNGWDGRRHPMRVRAGSGVWELFIPGIGAGALYKFEIRARDGSLRAKSDPYGRQFERRPATAAIVCADGAFAWTDGDWLAQRAAHDWQHAPLSIYEVHAGSWRRGRGGEFLSWDELARELVPYVKELGFTHIELMPVSEHPYDASWGYQTTGFFAPTSRFGSPDDFRRFVDACHAAGIGVILDWVAGHFPRDDHALMRFDGTALYEHEDPRRGEHRDWGTLIFNYSRREVRSFLLSNAACWIEEFHIDGLRVDAVASMLYLDYSRGPGEWVPNQYGGNENLEAIDFLRDLNSHVMRRFPGAVTIAEESTAWPQVTRPPWVGGLGFAMKWNMGWMNDTLSYMAKDPIHRRYHHDRLTFGMLYAYHENFILPLSHDEVVHGKGSLLAKMPGDDWQRFANLRLLYGWQFTYPGKKLLFMGQELAPWREWDHGAELDWSLAREPWHRGMRALVRDLNRIYVECPELHHDEFDGSGFEWLDCHDALQSVLCYLRRHGTAFLVVALNFTPVPRRGYRVGVPAPGRYLEIFNSDSIYYCGGNVGNGSVEAEAKPWMGRPYSLSLTLPPLGVLILRPPAGERG
jgi:1,4-alpha-glucan branching enzyme